MTIKFIAKTRRILTTLIVINWVTLSLLAQDPGIEISGNVKDAATGDPLQQVSISVTTTGNSSLTNEQGEFTITVPDLQAEISINLPGYNIATMFLNGRDRISVSLVSSDFTSLDNVYNTPLGPVVNKTNVFPVSSVSEKDLDLGNTTSFDQGLQGRIAGLSSIDQSGMPGHRTYLNLRGYSSLFAQSEPLLFIDGMIHEYSHASNSLMEGFSINPFDVLDIEDVSDISVLKGGNSYLGSVSSNGLISINTEQQAEASTIIKFSAVGGVNLVPTRLSVLNAGQFETYFSDVLASQGYTPGQIDAMYPWLNGDNTAADYYKYNNASDWQDVVYKPASLYKAYFFIKGGDDIATYNISTGYTAQNGIYDNSRYTRFNLRINGKVNISDKFSVTPNVKLSLADSKLANQGAKVYKNPVISTLLKSPIMDPIARDAVTGETLTYLDDIGVFGVSNPSAIVENAQGVNRNYHFLSSIRADYRFNDHFNIYTLLGINFNNARESIFLPDLGIVQVDSVYNSPGVSVNEYRSTQNHTALTYTNQTDNGHKIVGNVGFRIMSNSYQYIQSLDLNTPSDDFKNLGDGSQYSFLRSTTGDNRKMVWVSYFGDLNYNIKDKYMFNAAVSYDGSSITNKKNRYNYFPSIGAAWRISSEDFMSNMEGIDDLKLRLSYAMTGNLFSTIYDYSKLYYTDARIDQLGVLIREVIPNDDLALEKKNTINTGVDLSLFGQSFNVHADYYLSMVNNLIIQQELPESFGYDIYFDNGGKLSNSGFELGLDYRKQAGNLLWMIGGTVAQAKTSVSALSFLKEGTDRIITNVPGGAQMVTMKGQPINAFYGYKTNGILTAAEAAAVIIGPKGVPMQAGDIKFVGIEDGIVDEKDKTIIGDPNPEIFGGLFTSLAFKNLELKADITYSVGNDVYNFVRSKTEALDSYANQSTTVLDHWTESNTGADLPRISYGDPTGNTVFSERWIEDGSYIRLSRLTLAYQLKSIGAGFRGATLYVTGTNLLTFTKYTGYDPEFMYLNNPFFMGMDFGMMPQTRSVIAGIKLDL
ncbi:SusC/RagA family TonB-linked outer membrane protein [Bacteroidota bacterium]